jgi:C-terminal processing protease CtpA/Prc
VVNLPPYVIEAKSLADSGFKFKARFRDHMIGAGIRELVIVEVGPQSEAKKAGLAVGDRILQIRDVKVEGLGLKELQDEFATKAVDGKVPLLIQSRGSDETRTVMLKFADLVPKKAVNKSPEPPAAPAK